MKNNSLKQVKVEFSDNLALAPIPKLAAYNIADLMRGISLYYPEFEQKVLTLGKSHQFKISVNGEFVATDEYDLQVFLPYEENIVVISALPVGSGRVVAGVGLLALGLSGVGLLGLSATTVGLLGASLVFTSIFKHPKTNSDTKSDKRSVNFSGVVNSQGSGQCLPLCFGKVSVGSIVISGQIVPYDSSV